MTFKTEYPFTIDDLRSTLKYEPETGKFYWAFRHGNLRGDRVFNSRYAGKLAGGGAIKAGEGYLRIKVFGTTVKAHRLAYAFMTGEWPTRYIDHINGDRQDNRWENLRLVDKEGNGRNQKRYYTNKSGKPGVRFHQKKQKWEAQIGSGNNREYLGAYETFEEALAVRENREKELDYHDNHGRST